MEDLFYETEEDKDDEGCLESLAEHDEEDGDGEEVLSHGGRGQSWDGEDIGLLSDNFS